VRPISGTLGCASSNFWIIRLAPQLSRRAKSHLTQPRSHNEQQRKKDAALIEFFFAFQLFLAGAFLTAMWHA
jgi:hypothetical protein